MLLDPKMYRVTGTVLLALMAACFCSEVKTRQVLCSPTSKLDTPIHSIFLEVHSVFLLFCEKTAYLSDTLNSKVNNGNIKI